jgi:hypothetical protein
MSTPPTTSLREQMELERSARIAWVVANAHRPAAQASAFVEPVETVATPPSIPTAPTAPAAPEIPVTTTAPKETFFQKFEAEFKKLIGEAPAVEVKIAAALPVATKLLATVLTLIPATAPEVPAVTAIVNKIQAGLVTSSVLIQGAANDPTVPGILADVTTNLSSIEAAAQITDPATVAKLNSTVAEIAGEVGAIASALPTA